MVLTIVFEISLRAIPNDYYNKRKNFEDNIDKIEVLVLGNSHAFRGINPHYLGANSFNMAYVSQSLDIDFEIIEKYKFKLTQLKKIILTISYSTFFSKLSDSPENWRLKNYYLYEKLNRYFSFNNSLEIMSNTFSVNVNRLIKYYIYSQNPLQADDLGYGKYDIKMNNDFTKTGLKASKRHSKELNRFNIQATFFDYKYKLLKLANWCKNNGIQLILCTLPAYKSYTKNLNSVQMDLTIEYCKYLNDNFNEVYYYNFLNDINFVKSDFFNADHLNDNGAKKLTLMLNELINGSK